MNKSILIIDDSPTSKNNVLSLFKEMNLQDEVELRYANNGFDGLVQIAEKTPDLVMVDWHMDGLDGLQVIQIIRGNEKYHDLPIIMFSADGSLTDKAKGLLLGANDFISKGLDYETYFHTLNAYLDLNY